MMLHRPDLKPGQIYRLYDGSVIQLVSSVPGDGTKWYVADWNSHAQDFTHDDNQIEPDDDIAMRLGDDYPYPNERLA